MFCMKQICKTDERKKKGNLMPGKGMKMFKKRKRESQRKRRWKEIKRSESEGKDTDKEESETFKKSKQNWRGENDECKGKTVRRGEEISVYLMILMSSLMLTWSGTRNLVLSSTGSCFSPLYLSMITCRRQKLDQQFISPLFLLLAGQLPWMVHFLCPLCVWDQWDVIRKLELPISDGEVK